MLIDGVRASGKTQTGRHHAASVVVLDDGSPSVAAALQVDPRLLLEGETPRLVDEWQLAPELWNTARHEIDRRGAKGQFIFTGSSVPAQDAMRHSGAHRFVRLRMRPMTLEERGLGVGTVSLGGLGDSLTVICQPLLSPRRWMFPQCSLPSCMEGGPQTLMW